MSCRLKPEELEKIASLLEAYRDKMARAVYEEALYLLEEGERALEAVEKLEKEVDSLIEKLRRGECPSISEKLHIRNAVYSFCTPDQRELVKEVYAKLRMRWTRQDEALACRMRASP